MKRESKFISRPDALFSRGTLVATVVALALTAGGGCDSTQTGGVIKRTHCASCSKDTTDTNGDGIFDGFPRGTGKGDAGDGAGGDGGGDCGNDCNSGGGGGGGGSTDDGVPSAPLRRLTQEELRHTLRDLFAGVTLPGPLVLNDGQGKGFDGDVTRQVPSDLVIEQMQTIALDVATAAVAQKAAVLPRLPAAGDATDEKSVGHDFIASFGPRAVRRPLTDAELTAYDALFDGNYDQERAAADGAAFAFDVALTTTIEAFLQSPQFLYRVETGGASVSSSSTTVPVAPYEMASRLSYLLWGTMPDADLFAAAAADELRTVDQLEVQARRMLADARAHDAVLSFHRQWLDLDKVLDSPKDAATFPSWTPSLQQSVRTEADRMIEETVFGSGDGTLRDLLTTTTTRVDAATAALYGIPAPANDWDLVSLPGEQRSGILTSSAFLASRAHAVYGSPVLRGVFVLDRFLCEAPPPPGSAVNTNPPSSDQTPTPMTNRERYAQHTSDTFCQGCHQSIDGIGMGLEGYDAIGRYRTTDNSFPVDDSGNLDGTEIGGSFNGGPELADMLASAPAVQDCVARHWLTWMRGRDEEGADWPQNDDVASQFEGNGDIKELLVAIIKSDAFRTIPKVNS